MTQLTIIKVIGAGLAGTEAAWQLASIIAEHKLPYHVELYEMRPKVMTPAHHTDRLAELVCSNSLGSELLTTARGLLIYEMQGFDSLIIRAAKHAQVPAGQALAVDRDVFAQQITQAIENNPHITLIREEFTGKINEGPMIIATGPLTSPSFAESIQSLLREVNPAAGSSYLHFFDAAAPIVTEESINMDIAFKASRYGKATEVSNEDGDYINCPFYNKVDFDNFYQALMAAERTELKDFEKESMRYFAGCMPIEAIAERGQQTLTFGPMKPVGLSDPRQPDRRAFAVVQLRQDNVTGSLYNIVGFQTNLKWGEQKRVFAMIPGLENLDIVRYGVMHQNIFINSPLFLNADMGLRAMPNISFAGQITGVEGYTESAATGIIAARALIAKLRGDSFVLPRETMMGALAHYVSHADPKNFQPMNSNWGIINFEPELLDKNLRRNKKLRQEYLVKRSQAVLTARLDRTLEAFK